MGITTSTCGVGRAIHVRPATETEPVPQNSEFRGAGSCQARSRRDPPRLQNCLRALPAGGTYKQAKFLGFPSDQTISFQWISFGLASFQWFPSDQTKPLGFIYAPFLSMVFRNQIFPLGSEPGKNRPLMPRLSYLAGCSFVYMRCFRTPSNSAVFQHHPENTLQLF